MSMQNLLHDPRPTSPSQWHWYASKNLTVQLLSNNRLHVTNNAGIPDSYIYTQLVLPPGTYRFGAEASDAQYGYEPNLLRVVVTPRDELAPATWTGNKGHYVTPANTVDTESTVEFRVMVGPRKNSAVWVSHLFVMTEADYQLMDIANFRWFDGSLIEAK